MGFLSQKEAPAVPDTEAQLELEQTAALAIQSAEENMPVTPTDTPPVASYQEAAGAGEAQQETSEIKTWCCCDQGTSTMWSVFEKN